MAKHFFSRGKKVAAVVSALTSALLLMTSCDDPTAKDPGQNANLGVIPSAGGPVDGFGTVGQPQIIDVPVAVPTWGTLELLARIDPADPHNERFLNDWVFHVYNIDDHGRKISPVFSAESGWNGGTVIGLPYYMFSLPLVVTAVNDALPLECPELPDPIPGAAAIDETDCHCHPFEIFIPPLCHDKAVWLLGPFESALWDFYREAAERSGEAWNPSQVDCGTWIANLQYLILTDEITDELNDISGLEYPYFRHEALEVALQENTHLLTPTRPPICMAERRHNGGGMERGDIIGLPVVLDDDVSPFETEAFPDNDPIVIGTNGIVSNICGTALAGNLAVGGDVFVNFQPAANHTYRLDDPDFPGIISDQADLIGNVDVAVYNTRLGNGRELDHAHYDDACALTSIIEFTNKDDDEVDLKAKSGVTFTNLFGGDATAVVQTSDGDQVVDDNDYWAIFRRNNGDTEEALDTTTVLAVELLGHRQVDFRDVLHMTYDLDNENLFLGLRGDYEMNEEEVDGERAFLAYTLHVWDGASEAGRRDVRENIANCYEAADVWALQFFNTLDFQDYGCLFDEDCDLLDLISPIEAAEFAVRSQCFSNSRSNQRWRTDASGFWSINTDHGVGGNVIVNPGWLAPNMDYEIYIQKFDEAVFKGPRTIRHSDDVGALMAELPTLVEGDRVLLKSEDNCCDDYDLVIPCVPEFTGFAGAPLIPFVPVTLGPPPPPGVVPVPVP